jgi:hypothetical protein
MANNSTYVLTVSITGSNTYRGVKARLCIPKHLFLSCDSFKRSDTGSQRQVTVPGLEDNNGGGISDYSCNNYDGGNDNSQGDTSGPGSTADLGNWNNQRPIRTYIQLWRHSRTTQRMYINQGSDCYNIKNEYLKCK